MAAAFHAAMTPQQYLAHNQRLWEELHDMLAPQAPPHAQRLPYPFKQSMLGLLASELPHLVSAAEEPRGARSTAAAAAAGGSTALAIAGGAPTAGVAAPAGAASGAALEALVLREARAAVGAEVGLDSDLVAEGLDSLALIELVRSALISLAPPPHHSCALRAR